MQTQGASLGEFIIVGVSFHAVARRWRISSDKAGSHGLVELK